MRRWLAAGLAIAVAMGATDARALVWPDVPDRIERDLSAPDANTRRIAAHELEQLGAARGGPLALKALNDPDDDVRLAAADAAIRLRVPQATEITLAWLLAKDPRARRKACEVARALPSPHAVAPLARALGDQDAEVREAAADALGNQGSPDAVSPLLGKLDDPSPAVRVEIVEALARIGDARAVVPLVGKARDSAQEVRQAVARALGELGDPRASQALLAQLRDNSNEVKREALAALGRLHAPDTVDAIAPFVSDRTPALRQAAMLALGKIGDAESVRVLVAALGTADDAGGGLDRDGVREALASVGAAALPALQAVLEGQPSPQVATSAAWILGEMRATTMAPVLVSAMRRGVLPVAAAMHALAGAGTPDTVAVVLEFVDDPSPVVRDEALRAARKLLDPAHPDGRAVEPLEAALRDPRATPKERADLATLLGRTGAPRAASTLVDLASARDPQIKLAALDALGMLGPLEGTTAPDDALVGKLGDPDAQVRLHAAVALAESGGARARDLLLAKLDAEEELDRSVVLVALGGVLSRAPSEPAIARLARDLELSAGPERDALLVAIGRAPLPSALRVVTNAAAQGEVDDRRTAVTLLAAHPGDAAAGAAARARLADVDGDVRAEAAWALGTLGQPGDVASLEALVRASDIDTAIDAAAAIGRIAARAKAKDLATRALCPHLADARAYVRANALAGLALSGARCGDGARERKMLADDDGDAVRAAAALAVFRAKSSPEDARALERCASGDRSGAVARRCRAGLEPPARTHGVEIYVIPEGTGTPHPRAAFALALADGLLHAGIADRRGAVFDPVAPDGELELRRASALAR